MSGLVQPFFQVRKLQCLHLHIERLDVAAGECVGLSGISGSGKTSLLRAMADLDRHDGEVWLQDRRCQDMPATQWRRQVAYMMAENVWWHDRVGEHFSQPPPAAWLAALALDENIVTRAVARLSTGERQRLALLRVLASQPQVLLLDEPTASLDPANVRRIEELVADYRRSRPAAVIWVSHDPQQIGRVAGRCYELVDGQLQGCPSWN